jgi:hypothetical protein
MAKTTKGRGSTKVKKAKATKKAPAKPKRTSPVKKAPAKPKTKKTGKRPAKAAEPLVQVSPQPCRHEHGPVEVGPDIAPGAAETDWRTAFGDVVDFLRYMDDIVRAIKQADVPPEEFITLLKDLDETGQTIRYVDDTKIPGLNPEERRELFRFFITDVFITKMRIQRELDPLENYELLKVTEVEQEGPLQKSSFPVFHRMFLGLMQTVITAHLNTGKGVAEAPEGEDDLFPDPALLDSLWTDEDKPVLGFNIDDLAEGLWAIIAPFDMLKLTSTAVMAYLTWRDPKMGEDLMVEALAALTPPVFILMATTQVLDSIAGGLITGRPLLRKVLDDGSGSRGAGFFFVLTEEGQKRLV